MVVFNPFWDYAEPEPILREVFGERNAAEGFALFSEINEAFMTLTGKPAPWNGDMKPISLDAEYFLNHSGGKFCSPLVMYFENNGFTQGPDSKLLNPIARTRIATILVAKYNKNWQRLWDINVAVYNPINNYDMVETRSTRGATSEAKVSQLDKLDEENVTTEYGKTETIEHGRTSDSMSYRYGINTDTSDPKPSEKDTMEEGGSTTTTDGGSDYTLRELSSASDSTTNSVGASEEDEELHRSGNIGVTTTQKMIEEERRLWIWNYFEQVFSDLDKELVLSFHDPCRV